MRPHTTVVFCGIGRAHQRKSGVGRIWYCRGDCRLPPNHDGECSPTAAPEPGAHEDDEGKEG